MMYKYFILVIVVWRVTHLLCNEDGPYDIIFKFSKLLSNTFLGALIDCFYCLSIWIGIIASLFIANTFYDIILFTFYYSGMAIIIEKLTNKNFE